MLFNVQNKKHIAVVVIHKEHAPLFCPLQAEADMVLSPIREQPDPAAILPSMRAVQQHEEEAYSQRLEMAFGGVAPALVARPPKPAVPLPPGSMMRPKPKFRPGGLAYAVARRREVA